MLGSQRVIDADALFVRQVRAPVGRLRLPRQIGDELVLGVEQFLLVDDVVAVEDGAALVAVRSMATHSGTLARIRVRATAPAIVEKAGRHAGRLTGVAPLQVLSVASRFTRGAVQRSRDTSEGTSSAPCARLAQPPANRRA